MITGGDTTQSSILDTTCYQMRWVCEIEHPFIFIYCDLACSVKLFIKISRQLLIYIYIDISSSLFN
jgi:hypothetical protein